MLLGWTSQKEVSGSDVHALGLEFKKCLLGGV